MKKEVKQEVKKEDVKKVEKKPAKKAAPKKVKYPAFVQRMIDEQKDLKEKMEKGMTALSNNTIEDPDSKELLALQIMAMNLYEDILDRRISYEILKLSAPVCDCCKK